MHLKFSAMTASIDCNENRHAQVVMRELGITYQHATPQSISDQWWFWNCENVPSPLPRYLSVLDLDPLEAVGWGLSQDEAEAISANSTSDLREMYERRAAEKGWPLPEKATEQPGFGERCSNWPCQLWRFHDGPCSTENGKDK